MARSQYGLFRNARRSSFNRSNLDETLLQVTTLGGLHCGVAYAVLWWYSPDFNVVTPDWTVFLAGWCIIAYYTLDCMDGKQARRTGSSSPVSGTNGRREPEMPFF